MHDLILE